ncbi:hypothetical protein [Novosphingobium mangrovi (ex Huang et al. 2023)]|uniref:Secreted protein n=1 Tax=Novosphingobium mangrovi (ex Huang et al. 2023) TaxID=2976432 RepID=A0ABT2I700_9SPHN|nr:hypothetical protein [Novosphingobium mangrovi (ex Huang et al. 2023)]MCT2400593.1 hypothetical protein [Novosphingobium mangrovi (ex Huang et al. 2023)]
MTVFAACLFTLAALASVWIIAASWRRYSAGALALRAQLKACPEYTEIHWRVIERSPLPTLASLRKDRAARRARRSVQAPGLEWPGMARAA